MNVPTPSSSANAVVTAVSTSSSYASPDTVTAPVVASSVLATVIVNESVTVASPSVAVITTAWSPTSALTGVPARTPVDAVKVNQSGTVVPVRVTVSPTSTSAVVTVYVYAASSSTAVTAVLEIVRASLVLATVTVNESVTDAVPSEAVITTE